MKKILVSVDGSENSKKAIREAINLASLNDGEVVLLHVINDTMGNPYITVKDHKEAIDKAFLDQGNIILDEAIEMFKEHDIKVETLLKHGDPGKTIINVAEEDNFDLIIMGSRGLNAISRAMLGSVSNKVLNHVNISVLIVK